MVEAAQGVHRQVIVCSRVLHPTMTLKLTREKPMNQDVEMEKEHAENEEGYENDYFLAGLPIRTRCTFIDWLCRSCTLRVRES